MENDKSKKSKKRSICINLLLILAVIALAVIPLYIARDAEFGGADGEAGKAISEIADGYEPWFSPVFEPPGSEIESMLFSLQAAIGAGIIGYGLGFLRGSRKKRDGEAA